MGKQVLIVDNVAAVRDTLKEAITELFSRQVRDGELRVETAPGGSAALVQCAVSPPDLILMDVDMPDQDGIEAFYALKQRQPDCAGRVVFLTGVAGAENVSARLERALADGALGCLLKPASATKIEELVTRYVFRA